MKTLRGFGLIEAVIWLAIIGTVVAGVNIAWSGFKERIAAPYVADQKAADQKLIDVAEKLASNAQADAKAAKDASALQSTKIKESEALALAAQASAREANVKYAALLAKRAPRASALAKQATDPVPAGRPCETVLSATDAVLRESLRALHEER